MSTNILITGATGNIGKELVKLFTSKKHPVRVAIRENSSKEGIENNEYVESTIVDFADPSSLVKAMKGIERLFLLTPFTPNMVELSNHLVDAAKSAGVSHIVKLSGAGAEQEAITLAKWHRSAEKYVEATNIPYTFLRPNSFFQNYINFFASSIKEQKAFYLPLGDGKVSYIDVRDIANVAYHVLTSEGHYNQSYLLTGPEAVSNEEIASSLTNALGHTITYVDIPEDAARQSMTGMGMPDILIQAMLELYQINKQGYTAGITQEVEKITGQEPIRLEQFIQDYLHILKL